MKVTANGLRPAGHVVAFNFSNGWTLSVREHYLGATVYAYPTGTTTEAGEHRFADGLSERSDIADDELPDLMVEVAALPAPLI